MAKHRFVLQLALCIFKELYLLLFPSLALNKVTVVVSDAVCGEHINDVEGFSFPWNECSVFRD